MTIFQKKMIFLNENRKTKIAAWFLTGVLLILLAVWIRSIFNQEDRPGTISENFENVLHHKENILKDEIKKLSRENFLQHESKRASRAREFQVLFEKEGIILLLYQNDSLVFWSSNMAPCPEKLIKFQEAKTFYLDKQQTGWYEVIYTRDSNRVYVGKILIRHFYPFENEYLKNDFGPGFTVPDGTEINSQAGRNNIYSSNGNFLVNLIIPGNVNLSQPRSFLLFILYLTGFLFLLAGLYKLYCYFENIFPNPWWFLLSFAIDVILLRLIQFYFRLPGVLYDSWLFGPGSFSSSHFLPSLGDFLVNSLLLLFISYVFFRHYPGIVNVRSWKKRHRILLVALLICLILYGFLLNFVVIRDLVINSTIPFNLQNISSLDFSSLLGFIIISACFLSFFLVGIRLLESVWDLLKPGSGNEDQKNKRPNITLTHILFYLILFSIAGTYTLNHFNGSVEKEKRKLLALKLGSPRDPMAEILFSKVEQEIMKDSVLEKIIADSSAFNPDQIEDSLEESIQKKYFRGYWNNYTLQVTLCTGNKMLHVQPQNYLINCDRYFQNIIIEFGKTTMSSHFYFLDYGYGYKNYLAVLPFMAGKGDQKRALNAYFEISSKLIFKDLGYPELLIDKKEGQMTDISGYSYAYYRNKKLLHRIGTVQYSLELDSSIYKQSRQPHFFTKEGYNHFFYPVDAGNVLIISIKDSTLLDKISPFSYLFFVFALFSLLFFILIRFPGILKISFLGLGDRLQIAMTGILVSSLLITGFLIVYYITSLNSEKNKENLNERTHSMLVELQHKIGAAKDFTELGKQDLNEQLTEFSNVFFADVNLFDPEGRLIATSRPEIFEEGLSSSLINEEALIQLKFKHRSFYIQNEKIGGYGYNSSYIPFFNEKNQLLAYLNLPYFARQEDLKKEISNFLVTFINVYVFLIIIGVFIALLVSKYISRPLRILASRISQLSYGKHNEKITWKRRDEIGQLVDEYNQMIDELVRSAELLARSERETAWREMAKQVAHEIKNPLTPMKLSVQHLEKSWREHTPDWDMRLEKFTKTMTEQIESLSAIASEFSDFAKMPVTDLERIDLAEILENVKTLYLDTSHIRVVFRYDPDKKYLILGDRKQLLRVFTNLINNAFEAIENVKDGWISIEVETLDNQHLIKISDNGYGIPDEISSRIFQPSFTTKSGGMGLGLAIVKSIIHNAGGKISFTSEKGTGTTFTLVFPGLEGLTDEKPS